MGAAISRRMKFGRNFIPAYNVQAVTTEEQVIVAAEISTEGGDFEQLCPMVSAAERELENAGVKERPEVVLADDARPAAAGPMTSCEG